MASRLSISISLTLILLGCMRAQPGPGPSCLCFEAQGSPGELYNPTTITHAGDGSGWLFVGEQRGYIWVFLDGVRDPTPFFDITASNIYVSSDFGLLSFVLHPDFQNNGLMYTYWSVEEDGSVYQKVSEFSLSSTEGVIDPTSERELYRILWDAEIELPQIGGLMLFGDDGYLYFGIGDGGCCYDPFEHSQNISTPYGAIHRIDVNSQSGELPYGIPTDNPFVNNPGAVPTIFSYGLRQPWKGSMDIGDRLTGEGRGRIFVGDVGDSDFEEVTIVQSGGNLGWPLFEGPLCLEPDNCDSIVHDAPISAYDRTQGICIIFGGMYRGCSIPDLNEWMIYVDYASKFFFGAVEDGPGMWPTQIIPTCSECPPGLTNDKGIFIISMGADEDGEYYFGSVSSIDPLQSGATVYKLVDPNNGAEPCSSS